MDLDEIDPGTLLEWLDGNLSIQDDERALQANALERLCMLLLMSSNVDRCFESFSPDVFVPALCRIFLDPNSPTYVLEVAARALTYFLDISNECANRVIRVEGALGAIARRLAVDSQSADRTEIDLAEQCIKILDRMSSADCFRELSSCVHFLIDLMGNKCHLLHDDCIQSGVQVVQRLCRSKAVDVYNPSTRHDLPDMRVLFNSPNAFIVDELLWCLPFLYKRNSPMPDPFPVQILNSPPLLSIMCRYVPQLDAAFIHNAYVPGEPLDIRTAESLMYCIFDKPRWESILSKDYDCSAVFGSLTRDQTAERCILHLLRSPLPFPEHIRVNCLIHWRDAHGHDLLSWTAALGSPVQLIYLLMMGFDPSDAIHASACTGKVENFRILLRFGADFENLDDTGRLASALAEERMKTRMVQLLNIAPIFWGTDFMVSSEHFLVIHKLPPGTLQAYIEALLSIEFASAKSFRLLYKLCSYLTYNQEFFIWVCRLMPDLPYKLTDIILQCLSSGSRADNEVTVLALRISNVLIQSHACLFNAHFIRLGVAEKIRKIREAILFENQELMNSEEIVFAQSQRQVAIANTSSSELQRQLFIPNLINSQTGHRIIGANTNMRTSLAMRILRQKPITWGHWRIVITTDNGYIYNDYNVIEIGRLSPKGQFYSYRDNLLYFMNTSLLADQKFRDNPVTREDDCSEAIFDMDQYMLFKDRFAFASNAAIVTTQSSDSNTDSARANSEGSNQETPTPLDLSGNQQSHSAAPIFSPQQGQDEVQTIPQDSLEISGVELSYPTTVNIQEVSSCSVNTSLLGKWSLHYSPENLRCPAFVIHEDQPKQVICFKSDEPNFFCVEFDGYQRLIRNIVKLPEGLDFPISADFNIHTTVPSRPDNLLLSSDVAEGRTHGVATASDGIDRSQASADSSNLEADSSLSFVRLKAASFRKQSLDLCDYLVGHFVVADASSALNSQSITLNNTYLKNIKEHCFQLLDDIQSKKFTRFELLSSSLTECLLNSDIIDLFGERRDHPGVSALVDMYLSELDEQLNSMELLDSYWPTSTNGNARHLSASSSSHEQQTSTPIRQSIRALNTIVKLDLIYDGSAGQSNTADGTTRYWVDDQKRIVCPEQAVSISVNYICIDQLISSLHDKLVLSWWQDNFENTNIAHMIRSDAPVCFMATAVNNDCDGIFGWIATNGGVCRWVDPGRAGLVTVSSSSSRGALNNRFRIMRRRQRFSSDEDSICGDNNIKRLNEPKIHRIGPESTARSRRNQSVQRKRYFQIDTGLYIRPSAYKLSWDTSEDKVKRILNWTMLISTDLRDWTKPDIADSSESTNCKIFRLADQDPESDGYKCGFRHYRFEHPDNDDITGEFIFDFKHFDLFGEIIDHYKALTNEPFRLRPPARPGHRRGVTSIITPFGLQSISTALTSNLGDRIAALESILSRDAETTGNVGNEPDDRNFRQLVEAADETSNRSFRSLLLAYTRQLDQSRNRSPRTHENPPASVNADEQVAVMAQGGDPSNIFEPASDISGQEPVGRNTSSEATSGNQTDEPIQSPDEHHHNEMGSGDGIDTAPNQDDIESPHLSQQPQDGSHNIASLVQDVTDTNTDGPERPSNEPQQGASTLANTLQSLSSQPTFRGLARQRGLRRSNPSYQWHSENRMPPAINEMAELLEEFSGLEEHHQDMMAQSMMDILMMQESLYGDIGSSNQERYERSGNERVVATVYTSEAGDEYVIGEGDIDLSIQDAQVMSEHNQSDYDTGTDDTLAEDEDMDEDYDEEEAEHLEGEIDTGYEADDHMVDRSNTSAANESISETAEGILRNLQIEGGNGGRQQIHAADPAQEHAFGDDTECHDDDTNEAGSSQQDPLSNVVFDNNGILLDASQFAEMQAAQLASTSSATTFSHQGAWDPNIEMERRDHQEHQHGVPTSLHPNRPPQPKTRFNTERTSKALIAAYDPRPYQYNDSSTRDISRERLGKVLHARQQRVVDESRMVDFALEFNDEHPDFQRLNIPQCRRLLKPHMFGCLFWHMRQMISRFDTAKREELNKVINDKLFRIRAVPSNVADAETDCMPMGGNLVDMRWDIRLPYILRQFFVLLLGTSASEDIDNSQFRSNRLIELVDSLLSNPSTVATSSIPTWIDQLVKQMPFLLPLSVRLRYFHATSFGTTRSLIWILQDTNQDRDFNIARYVGRLKKERCSLRRDQLLEDGCDVLEFHARHKSELEMVWDGEDGTGLGPTMEFYTLFCSELMKVDHGLWITGSQPQQLGNHVHTSFGLFPAPYPPNHTNLPRVVKLFKMLGILIGKCLQDNRQCGDLNLSKPLLSMICHPVDRRSTKSPVQTFDPFSVLGYDDFVVLQPERARIFEQFHNCSHRIKDMAYLPSSEHYGYSECALSSERSPSEDVTQETMEEYIKSTVDFVLNTGIREQINALIDGISQVLPIDSLNCFTPEELHGLICGDLTPNWTRDDLVQFVEPRNGYTRESETYQYLIDTLMELQPHERKEVIQFITGCRTLPVGGIAYLNPPLTVVKKEGSGYPSVNTCNHFLKLPEYSSQPELKEKLLCSCLERGFYFN